MPRKLLLVLPLVMAMAMAAPARAESDAPASGSDAPVSESTALAIGLAGTFVPIVAGGLIMTGMAVDDRWFQGYVAGTYAFASLGLALGPALAYGYMGKKLYASLSALTRLGLAGLGASMMWTTGPPGTILSLMIIPIILGSWAIVDLALIRRVARKTNKQIETALAPWMDGRGGAGLAVCGRF
ncbi:MAG: hypothetical protein JRG91_11075 [Deltaproteobacteria bacterium]|nr:hypothetical protein [Deltaproteobacteria bacterium]